MSLAADSPRDAFVAASVMTYKRSNTTPVTYNHCEVARSLFRFATTSPRAGLRHVARDDGSSRLLDEIICCADKKNAMRLDLSPPYSYRADPAVLTFDDRGPVVFVDGACALCSRSARIVARLDRTGEFRIAPVQGDLGRAVLAHYGLDANDPTSWLYLENGRAYASLDAVIRAGRRLGGLGWLAATLALLPDGFGTGSINGSRATDIAGSVAPIFAPCPILNCVAVCWSDVSSAAEWSRISPAMGLSPAAVRQRQVFGRSAVRRRRRDQRREQRVGGGSQAQRPPAVGQRPLPAARAHR